MGKRPEKPSKKQGKKKAASQSRGSKAWSMFSLASAVVGATAAKKTLNASWKAATGGPPPKNPADPRVSTREAVTWVITSAVVSQLGRTLATRRAARYYLRSTGTNPPPPKLSKK